MEKDVPAGAFELNGGELGELLRRRDADNAERSAVDDVQMGSVGLDYVGFVDAFHLDGCLGEVGVGRGDAVVAALECRWRSRGGYGAVGGTFERDLIHDRWISAKSEEGDVA